MATTPQKPTDQSQEELLLDNHQYVGRGLIYLGQELSPFVQHQMQDTYGKDWQVLAEERLRDKAFHIQENGVNLEDVQALLQIIIRERDAAFVAPLSRDEVSLVFEVAEIRRKWAHPRLRSWAELKDFTPKYTYRALDKMFQLSIAIAAESAQQRIEALMNEVVPLLQQKSKTEDKLQRSLIAEKTEGFVGRKFVFQAIDEFLNTESKGYFVIEADPGVGKSAILAKYVQKTGCIAHFNVRSQGINRADQFLESVCTQLIERYHLPYTSLPVEAKGDGKFLTKLLEEVRDKLKSGVRLVIAVDALDEVDSADHSASNILYLPSSLPEHIYFLITQRQVTLPLRVNTPIRRFNLMLYETESLKDIETYIRGALQRSQLKVWVQSQGLADDDFVIQLASKSENNFMYLRYVLGDIENGRYEDLSIDSLPQGLEAYYEDHWQHMGMLTKPLPRTKIKIVYVLSELRDPASRDLIADFAQEDAFTVQEVLDEWEQFLQEEQIDGENRYGIYHQSFCDFLSRKNIVQAAGITLERINAQIADSLTQGVFGDE